MCVGVCVCVCVCVWVCPVQNLNCSYYTVSESSYRQPFPVVKLTQGKVSTSFPGSTPQAPLPKLHSSFLHVLQVIKAGVEAYKTTRLNRVRITL